jgi:hypothetical protein
MLNASRIASPPARLDDIVAEYIAPAATAVDRDGIYPETALRELGRAGAYAHHPGGTADGLTAAIAASATVAEACLSTAFCMWCQNTLAWYLDRSGNPDLATVRDEIAAGRRLGGTGLSNPMKAFSGIEPLALKGRRVPGGYRVSGRLPWVSNLGPDHLFASIFALEDGRRVMALFDCADPAITLSQNARFLALEGTATYGIALRDAFVPDRNVIAEDAAEFVPRIRQGFVLLQLGMAVGLARGTANAMLQDSAGRRAAAWLPLQPADILRRADQIMAAAAGHVAGHADPGQAAFHAVLATRLEASWLALDATRAGLLQMGARGYLQGADMFRRQREAHFVAIVTPSVKHITRELAAADQRSIA